MRWRGKEQQVRYKLAHPVNMLGFHCRRQNSRNWIRVWRCGLGTARRHVVLGLKSAERNGRIRGSIPKVTLIMRLSSTHTGMSTVMLLWLCAGLLLLSEKLWHVLYFLYTTAVTDQLLQQQWLPLISSVTVCHLQGVQDARTDWKRVYHRPVATAQLHCV